MEIMTSVAVVLGWVFLVVAGLAVVYWLFWSLFRVKGLNDELEAVRSRMGGHEWKLKMALDAMDEAKKMEHRICALKKQIGEMCDHQQRERNRFSKHHSAQYSQAIYRMWEAEQKIETLERNHYHCQNQASIALGIAKKNEIDSEHLEEFGERLEDLEGSEPVWKQRTDSLKKENQNLNLALNEMLGELGRQGQAIHALKVGKANKVTPPANKSPRAKKSGATA